MTASPEGDAPLGDRGRGRVTRRTVAGVVLCLVPLVAVAASPLRAQTGLIYVGLLPTFVALTLGTRVAALVASSSGVVMLAGLLLSSSPAGGAVLMALLGLAVAWAYTRGWQVAVMYLGTQAALATVAAPRTSLLDEARHPPGSLANAALVAGFVLVAGLWVAGVGAALLRDLAVAPTTHPWDRQLVRFAVTLAALLGTCTFVIMRTTSGGNAWWVLLTILVSLNPTSDGSTDRAVQRAVGTVSGGAFAAVLVVAVGSGWVLTVLGLVASVASAAAFVKAPYSVFATALTIALVLLTFPEGRVLRGDVERVGYTVLAAALVVAVTAIVDRATTSAPAA